MNEKGYFVEVFSSFVNLTLQGVTAATAKREFRRCDQKNVGRVTISDFKTTCRRFGIAFGAEDVYRLATVLDHECTGAHNVHLRRIIEKF